MSYHHFMRFTTLCLIPFYIMGCTHQNESDPRTIAPLVRVATIQEENVSNLGSFTGIVGARIESNLGFRVSGKVVKRFVDTGQVVKKGQILIRIDPTDLELANKSQQESVKSAQARAEQALKDEARYRDLLRSGAISNSAYDQVKATLDMAKAQLLSAQSQAKITLNNRQYSDLIADSDGTITETLAEPGQVVNAGQTVIRLAHSGQKEAVVQLPENVRPEIGTTGEAILFGQKNVKVPIKLRQLSNTADQQTRTYEARFILEGALNNVPFGSTVNVAIAKQNHDTQPLLKIPLGSLLGRDKESGVWLINQKTQTVIWHPVIVKTVDDDYAYVIGNLHSGEQIVALGAHLLKQNEKIRIESKVIYSPTSQESSHG